MAADAIKATHHVELFTTAARLTADGGRWIVPVHAWVYEPQDSRVRKAAFAAVLRKRYKLEPTPETQANFDRRTNLLFADNKRGHQLTVVIAGQRFVLPPTRPNGHTQAEIALAADTVQAHARDGRLRLDVVLPAGDSRALGGTALLVSPDGLGVISDIDDTVKISGVLDRAQLFDATFLQDFKTVPGMAPLYAGWAAQGASFHYVSSSPWHLYAPLNEMLTAGGFPAATFSLKAIRLKDRTIRDLFKNATATKPPAIEALLAALPRRRFVLVGDSGEQDPEVYGDIARRHPGRIAQILIRNVTADKADDARFKKAFAGLPEGTWQLFDKPADIRWRP